MNISLFIAVSLFLLFTDPAVADYIFPEDIDIAFSREFSQTEVYTGDTILVTFRLLNIEPESIRGFYYSDQIPGGLLVFGDSVWVNKVEVSDFLYETDDIGSIYQKYVPHRWVLDLPLRKDSVNNLIGPDSGSLRVVYSFVCLESGIYVFPNYNWIGVTEGNPPRMSFGYGNSDLIVVRRPGTPCGDTNGDSVVSVADATYLLYYVCGRGYPSLGEADVNLDGRITGADVIYILLYIYRGGPPPCEPGSE